MNRIDFNNCGGSGSPSAFERVLVLAERQHGVVDREQIVALDIKESWIDYAVRRKLLHVQHAGVYAVGRRDLTLRGRWMAAVLACGPGAALSHRDAGHLHDMRRSGHRGIDVIAPRGGSSDRPGIVIHRVKALDPRDVMIVDGIPVTTPARTLLDLADVRRVDLDRTAARAYELRLLTVDDVDRQLGARGRRTRKLAKALRVPPRRSRSQAEADFLSMLEAHGVPKPKENLWFPELMVEGDFVWLEAGLVFELDTGPHHRTPHGIENDARKDELLRGIGLTVMRRCYGNLEAVRAIQAFLTG